MAIKLKLLDAQEERFAAGTVITAYQIIATVKGRDRVVDYPNSEQQAKERLSKWQQVNPDVTFRIV